MTEYKKFMLGIAGAHWAAPVFVVDAACTGPVGQHFYMKMPDGNRLLVCRVDRGIAQLYVLAVVQCLMDAEQAYARMLGYCNMCVYMFGAEQDTFEANLVSDFQPFMRALQAVPRPLPFAALINEWRPVLAHERLDPERVKAVLPAGVPILQTTFPFPARPDGHVVFMDFIDRLFGTPLPGDDE